MNFGDVLLLVLGVPFLLAMLGLLIIYGWAIYSRLIGGPGPVLTMRFWGAKYSAWLGRRAAGGLGSSPQVMKGGELLALPVIWGTVAGAGVVAFLLLLIAFFRDLSLAGRGCSFDVQSGFPQSVAGVISYRLCADAVLAAQARVRWEAGALLLLGGVGGGGIALWRRHLKSRSRPNAKTADPGPEG